MPKARKAFYYYHPGRPALSSNRWVFSILDRVEWVIIILLICPYLNSSAYLLIANVIILFICIFSGCKGGEFEHPSCSPSYRVPTFFSICTWLCHRHLIQSPPLLTSRIKLTSLQLVHNLSYHILQIFTLQHLLTLPSCLFPFPGLLWSLSGLWSNMIGLTAHLCNIVHSLLCCQINFLMWHFIPTTSLLKAPPYSHYLVRKFPLPTFQPGI